MDIDFFSTRNPAQRSLPFVDHPSFAKAIWRLARAVPIIQGDAFYDVLTRLSDAGEDPAQLVARMLKVATGTDYEPRPKAEEVTRTTHAAVERFTKLTPGQRKHAYGALLRAHLADHQATPGELVELVAGFQAAAQVVLSQPGAAKLVLVARSEMYTTKRQAANIEAFVKAALEELMLMSCL
jgi:hypothetical protein